MTAAEYEEYASRYNLKRFVDAHHDIYASALKEVRSGEKQSHWMWYIFPQLRGLGYSRDSDYYGIADRDEAVMFLHHPVLGRNICPAIYGTLSDALMKPVLLSTKCQNKSAV